MLSALRWEDRHCASTLKPRGKHVCLKRMSVGSDVIPELPRPR